MEQHSLRYSRFHTCICQTVTHIRLWQLVSCVRETVVCGILTESGTSCVEWVGCGCENRGRVVASVSHHRESVCACVTRVLVLVKACLFKDTSRPLTRHSSGPGRSQRTAFCISYRTENL